jgi:hypothetical protein
VNGLCDLGEVLVRHAQFFDQIELARCECNGRHTQNYRYDFRLLMTGGDKRTLYDKVWDFFWSPIRWVAGVLLAHEWFPRFEPWISRGTSRKVAREDRG